MMAGLIFANSYGGRPGEWSGLTRAEVEKFVASDANCIVMEDLGVTDAWVCDLPGLLELGRPPPEQAPSVHEPPASESKHPPSL